MLIKAKKPRDPSFARKHLEGAPEDVAFVGRDRCGAAFKTFCVELKQAP
jgi:hypothetical protein